MTRGATDRPDVWMSGVASLLSCLIAAAAVPSTLGAARAEQTAPSPGRVPEPVSTQAPPANAQAPKAKPPDATRPPDGSADQTAGPQTGTSAVVMDLSAIESVIGKSVKSSSGEDLGRIVDLLVTTTGQVRAAVIDFGGFLGVGSRKIAIDWKALDFANFTHDGTVRLALTRNQVRVSPEYKSGDPVVILQATTTSEAKGQGEPRSDGGKPNGGKPVDATPVLSKTAGPPQPGPPSPSAAAPASPPQGGALKH